MDSDLKMWRCSICNKRFSEKCSTKTHLENIHPNNEGKFVEYFQVTISLFTYVVMLQKILNCGAPQFNIFCDLTKNFFNATIKLHF